MVEEGLEHEELGLRGFDINLLDEEMEVCVGEDVKEFLYLLMIMKLWTGDEEDYINRMSKNMYKDNGREGTQENGQFWKIQRFSRNKYWKTLGVFYQHIPLALGG